MTANTQVVMDKDGTAWVSTSHTHLEHWGQAELLDAERHSQECCESRRVAYPSGASNCVCLACEVDNARRFFEAKAASGKRG